MPSLRRRNQFTSSEKEYRQNHGRPGVVYILENPGLREGWWKIGCSTRSGHHRARDLNFDATTGTPGAFRCVVEFKTLDCGLAEERVFAELMSERRGKRGQEYFEVSLAVAQQVIERCCVAVDREIRPPPPPLPRPTLAPPPSPSGGTVQPEPPGATVKPSAPTPGLSELPVAHQIPVPPRLRIDESLPVSSISYPNRYCGHCRTLVLPRTKLLFFKYCSHCANALD